MLNWCAYFKDSVNQSLYAKGAKAPSAPAPDPTFAVLHTDTRKEETLEAVLRGKAIELHLVGGDRLFIVADEEDAAKLDARRGEVYTAVEVEHIVTVEDVDMVRAVHEFKHRLNGVVIGVHGKP